MGNNSLDQHSEGNLLAFAGYQWTYFTSLQDGPLRSRAESFLGSVNWLALLDYASRKRAGTKCVLLPDIGLGQNHMVRIIEFTDGIRWVARLRLPPQVTADVNEDNRETMAKCEHATISVVQERTSIQIPHVYAFEAQNDSDIGAPFMLMDCLEGNVGMDLGMQVPSEYKQSFFMGLAKIHSFNIQVQLSMVQLPKIGTIISINEDGTYQQGPIPGLGGPFDTATDFFQAWADNAKFGMADEQLRKALGPYADEILPSVSSFPKSIRDLSHKLSIRDQGPFPLCHGDFGHNNIIVDDKYRIIGVIDWEMAYAGPWEIFSDFPLTLSTVPPAMDAPWNYDEAGVPKDADLVKQFADQKDYVEAVKKEENSFVGTHHLSQALEDLRRQQLATAMRLYQNGRAGWYSKVVDQFVFDK
ncbi:putative Aminoglycoside phosphotransferase domain-containing protein [Seiridium cardinale]